MTLAHSNEFESQPLILDRQESHASSLSTSRLSDVQRLNQNTDLKPGMVPKVSIAERGDLYFCSEPVKETHEEVLNRKIDKLFGGTDEVRKNLNNHDWLIENREKLQKGFAKASNDEAWDVVWRMSELSKVDGKPLLYLTKLDGPTRGNLIPKTYEIHLHRDWLPDNYIGRVTH